MGRQETIIRTECIHVLDMELAKLIGFCGPFGYVKDGVSCHLKDGGFPVTFTPTRCVTDAMMAAITLKFTVKMEDDYVFVSGPAADCHVDYNGTELHHKVRAVCVGIMRVASLHLNIPLK